MDQSVENHLFENLLGGDQQYEPKTIFILAAPRTGSTAVYKAMATFLNLPYISNFTNDIFFATPIVGMAIQKSIPTKMNWAARYGKTQGQFQPSEGSGVMCHWFGGGHPSQLVSHSIKPGAERHFKNTLRAIEKLYQAPLVIKNAWNCFRVKYLAQALPSAHFVWLQRDLVESASSDLYARYVNQKHVNDWNSATPANYQELQKCNPVEQVVENQFEFKKAIYDNLEQFAKSRYIKVWFEDFLADRQSEIQRIATKFDLPIPDGNIEYRFDSAEQKKLSPNEVEAIRDYIHSKNNYERLRGLVYGAQR